jgi:hypothetical protein
MSNKYGKTYHDILLKFTWSPFCPQIILLAYERATPRKLQEQKGVFKHEPISYVDYTHDMEIDIEGLDGDKAEVIKMMALHRSNVPNNTWSLPRGYDYDGSKPNYPRKPELWILSKPV